MSEFDKEAEREKLRRKYEEDKADREVTQQMSELLLQGATMTNQHCNNCGSPIFRYDGQSFCPTCQGSANSEAAAAEQQTDEASQPAETAQNQSTPEQTSQTTDTNDTTDAATQQPTADERSKDRTPTANARPAAEAGGLNDARNALVRKLTQLTQEAEQTTDVSRTRDLLAASKEAAEALEALDRATQYGR